MTLRSRRRAESARQSHCHPVKYPAMPNHLAPSLLILILLNAAVSAAENTPQDGISVLPNNPISTLRSGAIHAHGTLEQVQLSDADSKENGLRHAVRCTVTAQPRQIWDVQFQFRTVRPVKKNEVLLAHFWARSLSAGAETGTAVIRPLFEMVAAPHDKSLAFDLDISPQWQEYFLPFKSLGAYAPGQAGGGFHLGFQPQTVEIADFELYSYGTEFDMKKLPRTVVGYRGQEPDAAWRKEAEKRIEQIRKGDIDITVVDAGGQPVRDAEVKIDMKRHAFGFGSAVTARLLSAESDDAKRYREIVEKYFSRVVFENDLKWGSWENERNREATLKAAQWLRDRNIEIRGHCLVWPSWQHTPSDLRVQSITNLKALQDKGFRRVQIVPRSTFFKHSFQGIRTGFLGYVPELSLLEQGFLFDAWLVFPLLSKQSQRT